jgi:hypothetical protein
LVGGPNDGALVVDYGPIYREPAPRSPKVVLYDPSALLSATEPEVRCREYRKERWSGDMGYRYVLITADLGQPSFDPVDPEHWR